MAAPTGETSLQTLLSTLMTVLHPDTYVFVTLAPGAELPPLADVQLLFRESEGTTLVTTLQTAEARGWAYAFPSRMITLDVHSSLEAVGFMAVVATRLAAKGMGVNPVSGYFHDHLFMPEGREAEAVEELRRLASESAGRRAA
ncbi:Ribonuclease h family protein [Colletotrichum higginsianum IMI 349063]|uniref:Ribonuclease h family protein n=1 Tax=Colletotrichum higginsianum (strain IMI 349063) TaxID=759273 RepID=A0A1B7XZY4_COLHI|nr:Ribonuclease h family protein [Colletotrichum higginsianum IMI 349063]OBR05317.1 Ribonuclease h family protein [Colletotrichum higginsianum IMI 349063]